MPSKVLTDTFCRTVKPQDTRMEYGDKLGYGLSLIVSKFAPGRSPTKVWYVRYKADDGSHPRKEIGAYLNEGGDAHLSVADARLKSMEFKSQRKQGLDPVREERDAKEKAKAVRASALTLKAAVDLFLADILPALKNDNSRASYRWYYDSVLFSEMDESLLLLDIDHAMIFAMIQRVKQRGPVLANRFRNKVNVFLKWCSDPERGLLTDDPSAKVRKPHKEKHRAADKRQLQDHELTFLLRAIQTTRCMEPEIKNILRLIALTSRRPQEICGLKFSHVEHLDDAAEALVNIPAYLMKTNLSYLMPVTPEVADILNAIFEQRRRETESGRPSEYLFQTRFVKTKGDRHVLANGVAQAMARLLDTLDPEAEGLSDEDRMAIRSILADRPTPYAFRRTVATGLAKLKKPKISREDRKAVMAHLEEDVLAAHYDAYERLDEKRAALMQWDEYVTDLMTGQRSTGVVVPFKRA